MNLANLIRAALIVSMLLLVLSLGLRSSAGDAGYLFRRPWLLLKSMLAMNIVMPLIIIWLVVSLDLRPVVKIALVALSVSPVPPFLPGKQLKLTQRQGYIYGLLVATAVLAILLVPLTTAILESFASQREHVAAPAHVPVATVLRIVALTVLLPLGAGMMCRRWWPGAERLARLAGLAEKVGTVLLVVAFLPVLVVQWPAMRSLLGDGTLLAIIAFTGVGLFIGHVLGGTDPQNRTVLALATASRHPAVAIAVASAVFPDEKLAPAAVLLSLIVGVVAAAPYSAWRRRVHQVERPATKESPLPRGP